MMTVQKAMNRIIFRMKKQKMYDADIEAINTIVDYINAQDEMAYMENILFAKLFMEKFMSLASTGKYNSSDCLVEIENILLKPLDDILEQFKTEVPFFKLHYVARSKMNVKDPFNFSEIIRERKRIARENEKQLMACLKTNYTKEEASSFLKNQVNRLTKIYNNPE